MFLRSKYFRGRGRGWEWGPEGEMTQAMYAHVNKWIIIIKKEISIFVQIIIN
jgi:hypothetical protein